MAARADTLASADPTPAKAPGARIIVATHEEGPVP